MSQLGRQIRELWPFKAIFEYAVQYQAVPQPSHNNIHQHQRRHKLTEKESLRDTPQYRKYVLVSFALGFAFASAIAAVLVLGIADLLFDRARGETYERPPSKASSRYTFTPNRAGVVLSTLPENQRFSAAHTNLTVPHWTPAMLSGGSTAGQAVSVWVGIDVNDEGSAGVRTGLNLLALPNGEMHVEAAYQWGSDGPRVFTKIGSISAGDAIELEVVMANSSYAKAEIHNFSTGGKATKFFTQPPSPMETLSGQHVAWTLEDPVESATDHAKSTSLLNFGRIALEDCIVWTDKDEILTVTQGDMYRIQQGGIARTGVHVEEEAVYFTFIE